jgi:ribonuclease BN (tRNA processing enzyme)
MSVLCAALSAAVPMSTSAQQAQSGTSLITLGTQGGPRHTQKRSQPANVIIANGQPYLVDAGNGVGRQLVLAGISPFRIRQIFITHHHDDHNADLGTLMGLVWSIGIPRPITVYGPVGTGEYIAGFEQLFRVNERVRRADFPGSYRIAPHEFFLYQEIGSAIEPKLVFKDQNIEVDAVENCHFHKSSGGYGDAVSYAYRFRTADKTIVISGDTGPCEALVEFARGADILVHEVINVELLAAAMSASGQLSPQAIQDQMRHMGEDHADAETVGKLAARAGVGMVVLTHVIPGDPSDPPAAYTDGVSRHFKGKVVLASDLDRF